MTAESRCPKCGALLPDDAPGGLCPKCLVQAGFESESIPNPAAGSDPAQQPTLKSPAGSGGGFEPLSAERLAPLFPQLEILELLGKGGMGAVYKARQRGLDRLVAVKILPPEIGHDAAFAERFTREARALAKLNHPHIVAVYDFGQVFVVPPADGTAETVNPGVATAERPPEGGTTNSGSTSGGATNGLFYIVMEYVDGVNLRQTIQSGSLASQQALAIVPQICEALQFAHDEGIVHRDIKPENILIDKKGRVKIADFGLAKLVGNESRDHFLTGTHQVMGTLRYMAPEQMQGSREVDHRADIYSLGVVFYELLTGELPMGRFAPPSKKVQVDVRLDEIVLRALEQEPEQRYQHASEVKTDVETIVHGPRTAVTAGETAGNPTVQPIELLDATSGWKSWLPIVTAAAGLICTLMLPIAALAGVNPTAWLLTGLGLVALGLVLGFLLTIRWTVEYQGHRIAFEYNSPLRIKRLIIDGRTAASGGLDRFCELRATIKHEQGIADEIVCTVEAGFFVGCRIIAQPKTPIAQAVEGVPRTVSAKNVAIPSHTEHTRRSPGEANLGRRIPIAAWIGVLPFIVVYASALAALRQPDWAGVARTVAMASLCLAAVYLSVHAVIGLVRRSRRTASEATGTEPRPWRIAMFFSLLLFFTTVFVINWVQSPFSGSSTGETAQLTFQVAGPQTEVTLNGKKVTISADGLARMQLRPGDYETAFLKGNLQVRRSYEFFYAGEVKQATERDVDNISIKGPLTLEIEPGSGQPAVADFMALQGRWKVAAQVKGGGFLMWQQRNKWIEFDLSIMRSDVPERPLHDPYHSEVRYAIDLGATPRHFDVTDLNLKGIYRIDGDTLTLAVADAGQPRPTEFASQSGSAVTLTLCRREHAPPLPPPDTGTVAGAPADSGAKKPRAQHADYVMWQRGPAGVLEQAGSQSLENVGDIGVFYPLTFARPPQLEFPAQDRMGDIRFEAREQTATGFRIYVSQHTGTGQLPRLAWRARGEPADPGEDAFSQSSTIEVKTGEFEVFYPIAFARPPHLVLPPNERNGEIRFTISQTTATGFKGSISQFSGVTGDMGRFVWKATGSKADGVSNQPSQAMPADIDGRVAALFKAATAGQAGRVKQLLDAGAGVNAKDADGQTPLMKAAAGGHRSLALALVLLGADLTEQDKRGQTALMIAAEKGDAALLEKLWELSRITFEQDAAKRQANLRTFPGVDKTLLADRDIDMRSIGMYEAEVLADENGETASIKAARAGDWACFKQLSNHMDSILARDKTRRTVLMHAILGGRAEQSYWLDQIEWLEKPPYVGVAGVNNIFVGTMLVFELDRSLSMLDRDGKSALVLAEENGQKQIARILRRHLEAIVRNQSMEIEKGGDDAAKHRRLRALAWQALGDQKKAEADFKPEQ